MAQMPAQLRSVHAWPPGLRAMEVEELMTDEERLALVAPRAPQRPGIPRLGVPGLRMDEARFGEAPPEHRADPPAPAALALGASFHPALARQAGNVLGAGARARGINVLAGGGVNLVRDAARTSGAACISEDPLLSALVGAALVNGIQDQGVIAALHHQTFDCAPAAQRESDLLALQMAIEWSQPGAIVPTGRPRLSPQLLERWAFEGWLMPQEESQPQRPPQPRLSQDVRRLLCAIYTVGLDREEPLARVDGGRQEALALEVARQGIVLLRNAGVLPLAAERPLRVAVIGGTLPALAALLPQARITCEEEADPAAAARHAREAEVAIVYAAGPQGDAVVEAVAAENRHTIVVLPDARPAAMPWRGRVQAILQAWYPAQAHGQAMAEVIAGRSAPSGRLPVTLRERALPDDERGCVGYRACAARGEQPLFAFGHGLGYTRFGFSELELSGGETITAAFTVTNHGEREGAAVPQLYLTRAPGGPLLRLLDFERIVLAPGASRRLRLAADPRLLADFDVDAGRWRIAGGTHAVALGRSAADLVLAGALHLQARVFGR